MAHKVPYLMGNGGAADEFRWYVICFSVDKAFGEVCVKEDKRSAVDVSRELIIDSIVLTKEVLHAIQNNLPMPLDNVFLQRIDSTAELESYERPEPSLRLLALILLLIGATIVLLML